MFRTITAKFPGTCKRCGGKFAPGTTIRFGGRGRTYHFASSCPAADSGLRFSSPPDFSAEPTRRDPTLHGLASGRYDGLDPFKGGEEATDADSFTFDSGHAPDIDVLWEDDCARRAGVA